MTAQEIFNLAVQKSNLNDAALIPEAEWLDYLVSFERGIYLEAARENPDFFGIDGDTATRGSSTGTWTLSSTPGNIGSITRVEVAAVVGTLPNLPVGTEVNVVSIRNVDASIAPRVFVRNRVAKEYNSELQTSSANYVSRLKLYYSFLPADKTDPEMAMDLPDEFNMLLVLPLAKLMAIRDQRPEDAVQIDQDYQFERAKFLMQVTVYDEVATRALDQLQASSRRIEQ